LGGSALSPAAAWTQPLRERQRKVGVLIGLADDSEARARVNVFERRLQELGWNVGQDLQVEYRYTAGSADRMRSSAEELVALQPDVILGHSTPVVTALAQAGRTVPIVFVVVSDPIGSGFVTSMARPGGNITGFTNLQATITGKYLSILNEIVPKLLRVALMYNPLSATQSGAYYMGAFIDSTKEVGVAPISAKVRTPAEIERIMSKLADQPGSGLVVMPDNFTTVHRKLIVALAARHRIPAIYPYRYFAEEGGLLSYGVDVMDLFRRASEYVDRILRGANPGDLPVQAPTKFEMVVNLRTAKVLGVTIPKILLASADAIIE
jgi:putative ABC transport system substrate-binding protein